MGGGGKSSPRRSLAQPLVSPDAIFSTLGEPSTHDCLSRFQWCHCPPPPPPPLRIKRRERPRCRRCVNVSPSTNPPHRVAHVWPEEGLVLMEPPSADLCHSLPNTPLPWTPPHLRLLFDLLDRCPTPSIDIIMSRFLQRRNSPAPQAALLSPVPSQSQPCDIGGMNELTPMLVTRCPRVPTGTQLVSFPHFVRYTSDSAGRMVYNVFIRNVNRNATRHSGGCPKFHCQHLVSIANTHLHRRPLEEMALWGGYMNALQPPRAPLIAWLFAPSICLIGRLVTSLFPRGKSHTSSIPECSNTIISCIRA